MSNGELVSLHGAALVVVADSSRTRVFRADHPAASLQEHEDLVNPEARLHEGDLVADSAGRVRRRIREGGHSAFGGGSAKRHRIEEFAALVCRRIEQVLRQTGALRLYLLAEPEFLGLLRRRMPPSVQQRVSVELSRSLARASPARIRAVLPQRL